MKALGTFKVSLLPLDYSQPPEHEAKIGRMSINKTFQGDLSANSKGEMLSATTNIKGSAGYVAIEQVSGTLNNKSGSFILQHFGIMSGSTHKLTLEVIPNSGTEELLGLSGSMQILISEGVHQYEFDYDIP